MAKNHDFPLKLKTEGQANPANIVLFGHMRFTILTTRLIRIEYDPLNHFTDHITQTFWHRYTPTVSFRVSTGESGLVLSTDDLVLRAIEVEEPIKGFVSVDVKSTKTSWAYGDKTTNLGGTTRTLDQADGGLGLEDGVISRDGFAIIEDSEALLLDEFGWPIQKDPERLDLYFFGYGHDYPAAVKDYTMISGNAPLVPRYVLGNWWSKYWTYKDTELLSVVDRFKTEGIPLSVCIVDTDWHIMEIKGVQDYWAGWTGYTVNKDYFPDLPGFIKKLHSRGLKTTFNLHPAGGVKAYEQQYPEFAAYMGINPKKKTTIPFDSASPKFMRGYFDLLLHPYEKMGVDFWWVDWQQGNKSNQEGLDPLWMLNHLHYYDAARNKKYRPFTFSRWSRYGAQRYPIGFSGDAMVTWKMLKFEPYFTATAANIGFGMWSHDIGGHFAGSEEPELYARWVEFGVFSPVLRLHSTCNRFNVREPWRQNPGIHAVVKNFMVLRHQLIPYIYSAVYKDHQEGLPLITPLYYWEPEEELAYSTQNGYYFGSELMVLPVTEKIDPETNRALMSVYFPNGTWTDFFTDEVYHGRGTLPLDFSLSHQAVYAKAGAIIPHSEKDELLADKNPEVLRIRIYLGADNSTVLYEDDGISNEYLEGNCFTTRFSLTQTPEKITFKIEPDKVAKPYMPEKRRYILDFVNVNGTVPKFSDHEEGTHKIVHIPASDITSKKEIVMTDWSKTDPKIPLINELETFLIDNVLPTELKGQIYDAFRSEADLQTIKKVYAKAPKPIRAVLDRYLDQMLSLK